MSKRSTFRVCLQESVPYLELNGTLSVNEMVGAEVEIYWYDVLVEICGVEATLRASQMEETFCMEAESAVVLQGCLVFSGEET